MVHRHAYCKVSISPVRAEAKDQSEIVTQLLFGEPITIQEVIEPWAKISIDSDGYEGYIDLKHFKILTDKEAKRWADGLSYLRDRERTLITPWGKQYICRGSFLPENKSDFNIGQDKFKLIGKEQLADNTPLEFALDYLNTPYLWGGKSPYGIDCSGITQTIYRLFGINLPRDASEQVEMGVKIDFEDLLEGDLAYFGNSDGKITHVGILDGKGGIIHASGSVRQDEFTEQGIINSENGILTHRLTCIKRV